MTKTSFNGLYNSIDRTFYFWCFLRNEKTISFEKCDLNFEFQKTVEESERSGAAHSSALQFFRSRLAEDRQNGAQHNANR